MSGPSRAENPPLLEVDGVSKAFTNVQALDDVSITVKQGEVVGLVGENGAGKSTLLRILSGVYRQDSGQVRVEGKEIQPSNSQEASEHGISIVHQETRVISSLRGYENLFLGADRHYTRAGIRDNQQMIADGNEIIESLGLDIDLEKPVSEYSFTQKKMVQIARSFVILERAEQPAILLDEPTAGLEEEGRELLFDRVNNLRDQASFVFVSHELDEVLELADRIYVLKDGVLVDEVRADEADEDYLKQKMVGRESSTEYYKESDQVRLQGDEDVVLSARHLSRGQELTDVSFELRQGEIMSVVGVEGSGKELLGRVLAGIEAPTEGSVELHGERMPGGEMPPFVKAGGAYISKDRKEEGLLLYRPLWHNISIALLDLDRFKDAVPLLGHLLPLVDHDAELETTFEMIEKLDIKTPGPNTLVNQLSGGNQQKVVLARWLARESSVMIFDNVTRGIDIGAKEEIYEILRELTDAGVTLILISDELPEAIGLANRIAVMKDGQMTDIVEAPANAKPEEGYLIEEMI